MQEINPSKIPINTIGLEVPGRAFSYLVEISKSTGGQSSIVHKGKLHTDLLPSSFPMILVMLQAFKIVVK